MSGHPTVTVVLVERIIDPVDRRDDDKSSGDLRYDDYDPDTCCPWSVTEKGEEMSMAKPASKPRSHTRDDLKQELIRPTPSPFILHALVRRFTDGKWRL